MTHSAGPQDHRSGGLDALRRGTCVRRAGELGELGVRRCTLTVGALAVVLGEAGQGMGWKPVQTTSRRVIRPRRTAT